MRKTVLKVPGSMMLASGMLKRPMTKLETPPTAKSTAARSTDPLINGAVRFNFLPQTSQSRSKELRVITPGGMLAV